jgi:hypothetical protein
MGTRIANPSVTSDYVYVPVPADRVEDVYRFLLGLADADGAVDSDLDRFVNRVYRESEEKFRRLLEFLADHPGTPLSTELVAEEIELERGTASLAGMLGAFGRRSTNRYDDFWPFERVYNSVDEQMELLMNPEVATILKRILAAED